MSFPYLARTTLKYKSPHSADLSFAKDETIRVTGASIDDEDWLVGESLDGSRSGGFPKDFIVAVESDGIIDPGPLELLSDTNSAPPIAPPSPLDSQAPVDVAAPMVPQVPHTPMSPPTAVVVGDDDSPRQSMKDRLAFFTAAQNKMAPPPIKPKPVSTGITWSQRQKLRQEQEAKERESSGDHVTTALDPTPEAAKPSPKGNDISSDSGGMSAADAVNAISKGGSLKERMAALAGAGAFSRSDEQSPATSKPSGKTWIRPPPSVTEQEEETQGQDDDVAPSSNSGLHTDSPLNLDEDDARTENEKNSARRAVIAARMAKIGARGPMNSMPLHPTAPVRKPTIDISTDSVNLENELEPEVSAPTVQESSVVDEQVPSPVLSSTLPASVKMPSIPRRAAPPRRRGPVTDVSTSAVNSNPQPQLVHESGDDTTERLVPTIADDGQTPPTTHEEPSLETIKDDADTGSLVLDEPAMSDMTKASVSSSENVEYDNSLPVNKLEHLRLEDGAADHSESNAVVGKASDDSTGPEDVDGNEMKLVSPSGDLHQSVLYEVTPTETMTYLSAGSQATLKDEVQDGSTSSADDNLVPDPPPRHRLSQDDYARLPVPSESLVRSPPAALEETTPCSPSLGREPYDVRADESDEGQGNDKDIGSVARTQSLSPPHAVPSLPPLQTSITASPDGSQSVPSPIKPPSITASPVGQLSSSTKSPTSFLDKATPADDDDISRRSGIAARMAKLGGIKFGMPPPKLKALSTSQSDTEQKTSVGPLSPLSPVDVGTRDAQSPVSDERTQAEMVSDPSSLTPDIANDDDETPEQEATRRRATLARLRAGGALGFGVFSHGSAAPTSTEDTEPKGDSPHSQQLTSDISSSPISEHGPGQHEVDFDSENEESEAPAPPPRVSGPGRSLPVDESPPPPPPRVWRSESLPPPSPRQEYLSSPPTAHSILPPSVAEVVEEENGPELSSHELNSSSFSPAPRASDINELSLVSEVVHQSNVPQPITEVSQEYNQSMEEAPNFDHLEDAPPPVPPNRPHRTSLPSPISPPMPTPTTQTIDASLNARSSISQHRPGFNELQQASATHGASLYRAARGMFDQGRRGYYGDGSPAGFVLRALEQARLPQPSNVWGQVVFEQEAGSVLKRLDEPRPGDIVAFHDARLKGKKGLQSYNQHVGSVEDPLVAVVSDFDQKNKHKLRVLQVERGVADEASYRLSDLKSGRVVVYRQGF